MAYTFIKDLTTVNYTKGNNGRKYIVIHYTGNKTDTAKANANYFRSTNRGSSAHYFVDKTSIYQVVADANTSWAVGKNYGSGNLFGTITNKNSLNIEMCSDNGKIAEETLENTIALTKDLMKKYSIPASNVYRHYDVCSKTCPGWTDWLGTAPTLWNRFKAHLDADFPSSPAAPANNFVTEVNYTVTVTASGLNVRRGPGTSYSIITVLKKDTSITITKEDDGWGCIGNGWISLKYTTKNPSPDSSASISAPTYTIGKTYTTQVELIVRKGPGTNYSPVGYSGLTSNAKKFDKDKDGAIDKGTKVTCKTVKHIVNNIWIQIPSGWIAAFYNNKIYAK